MISDIPWHEMDVNDELRLQTTSEWSRYHEGELRKLIYPWERRARGHGCGTDGVLPTGGPQTPASVLPKTVNISVTDEASSIVSRHFNLQIRDEEDLEKIKDFRS